MADPTLRPDWPAFRDRQIRLLRKVVRDMEDLLATLQWWNNNRLDAEPFDCEKQQVGLPIFRRMLAEFEANRMPSDDLCRQSMEWAEGEAKEMSDG